MLNLLYYENDKILFLVAVHFLKLHLNEDNSTKEILTKIDMYAPSRDAVSLDVLVIHDNQQDTLKYRQSSCKFKMADYKAEGEYVICL